MADEPTPADGGIRDQSDGEEGGVTIQPNDSEGGATAPGLSGLDPEVAAAKGLDGFPMPEGVPPEIAARIDQLAPPKPPYVLTDAERERWALCARAGAAIAIDQGGDASDRDLEQAAWLTARALYRDEESFPTGQPEDYAAAVGEGTPAPTPA